MRLLEAIVDANQRALAGDTTAGLRPKEFADALPLIALTCIDPRLNPLLPEVLGIEEKDFIWLRNSGNNIFEPMSTMTRTLALACAVKGGKEIVIIGHTDCHVRKTSTSDLVERFKALGIERTRLPENLNEFFGLFASERQNVIRSAGVVRDSPLIGPNVPVHGLLVDIVSGKLEWLVNGYETLGRPMAAPNVTKDLGDWLKTAPHIGDLKLAETKIGDFATHVGQAADKIGDFAHKVAGSTLGQHTKIGGMAAHLEQIVQKIGETATGVGNWSNKPQPSTAPSKSPPPVPPAATTPPPAPRQHVPVPPPPPAGGLKPIPMPPRIANRPPPPRKSRDE